MSAAVHGGLTALAVIVVVLGASAQAPHGHEDWSAPASAESLRNPLTPGNDTAAGGAKLYRERCRVCHGDDARGTARGPDLSRLHVQSESDGALFWKISSGNARTGMPGFSYLPVPQRWQLVQHLRALHPSKRGIPGS